MLKNLITTLKNPKVKLWFILVSIVIIVSVSITSVVMIATPVEFSKSLRPELNQVRMISVMNENLISSPRTTFYNSYVGYTDNANDGKMVKEILEKLYDASKTTRFTQVLSGQAFGKETTKYDTSMTSKSKLGSTYIEIVFHEPVYVITDTQSSSNAIEKYDPNYGAGIASPSPSVSSYNNTLVVNKIYVALSDKNSFSSQTWYLNLSSNKMQNTTTVFMSYSFKTYANYYNLYKFVSSITEDDFV